MVVGLLWFGTGMLKLMRVWSVQVIGDRLSTVMLLKEDKIGSRRCLAAWVGSGTCWVRQRLSRRAIKLGIGAVFQVEVQVSGENEGAGVYDEGGDEIHDVAAEVGAESWWSVYEGSTPGKAGCNV